MAMDAAKSVTATFALDQHELSAAVDGSGGGNVTSEPAGINCPTDCSEPYGYGTIVTLTHTADTGSIFVGWSGACTGTSDCAVTMTDIQSVTATFSEEEYILYLPVILR